MVGKVLTKENLGKLVEKLSGGGSVVVAPKDVDGQLFYAPVRNLDEMASDYINPKNSFKEFLFPQTETVATYSILKDSIEMGGVSIDPPKVLVLGSRPCDAASVASLRSVFLWGADEGDGAEEMFKDEFFTRREDNSVVMSVACLKGDEDCFCTTVGLAPDSRDGSDILLKESKNGNFIVDVVSDRGREFLEGFNDLVSDGNEVAKEIEFPEVIEEFDAKKTGELLKNTKNFDLSVWEEVSRKCLGCGACTFSCPTCHCFDVTDETFGYEGERKKNWDACQFEFFTLHASGHNPRDAQYKRWRNRFLCKFHIYPSKFCSIGCVGCGRCIRVCSVGVDITEAMIKSSSNE